MIMLALLSINTQFSDRKMNLEAYAYKKNAHLQYENYRTLRERVTRLGGNREEYQSDYSAQRLDQDDEDEDQLMANHRNR